MDAVTVDQSTNWVGDVSRCFNSPAATPVRQHPQPCHPSGHGCLPTSEPRNPPTANATPTARAAGPPLDHPEATKGHDFAQIRDPNHLQNRRWPTCLKKGRDRIDQGKGKAEKWPMATSDARVGSSSLRNRVPPPHRRA